MRSGSSHGDRLRRMRAILAAFVLAGCAFAWGNPTPDCPCADPSLCNPVTGERAKEVYIFVTDTSRWQELDWSRITTLALFTEFNAELMCYAHSRGVRVVFGDNFPVAQLANATARSEWIQAGVARMRNTHTDGVNIDFESAVAEGSEAVQQLSALVADAAAAYKAAVPTCQVRVGNPTCCGWTGYRMCANPEAGAPGNGDVFECDAGVRCDYAYSDKHCDRGALVTFDVAWSPRCIDGRCFNATALAESTDFLIVMDYDTRSQLNAQSCAAGANAPLVTVDEALANYTALAVPASKLVLGVPWYGYDYPCEGAAPAGQQGCAVKPVPFRGAPCSDAAGVEVCYTQLVHMLRANSTSGRRWDTVSQTPFFQYASAVDAKTHEVWFDDVESLTLKYKRAAAAGLRGVGMWEANCVDYDPDSQGDKQLALSMWQALDAFLDSRKR